MRRINSKTLATLILVSASLTLGFTHVDITKRIRFAKGKTSATVRNSVLRDEVHYYLVNIRQGQNLSVKVTSLEKNASFRIMKPSGGYVDGAGEMDEPTAWSGTVSESGDYKIEVAPDRGNATYRLTVSVKY
jgi:hypothetical protein